MDLGAAIDQFLAIHVEARGLAAHSATAYRQDLGGFHRYVTRDGIQPIQVQRLTPLEFKDYLAHLRDDMGYRPKSLARLMTSLRLFGAWLEKSGLVDSNPGLGLKNPRMERRLPLFLLDDELRRLLQIDGMADETARRDHTILMTFLYTGLRLSELTGLKVRDLDLSTGTARVMGKGARERIIPLHPVLREKLQGWLRTRSIPPLPDTALFPRDEQGHLTTRQVGYIVRKSVLAAGISTRITPHKLRHTFATQLLHRGADLVEIKELLGHSQLATTSIHTHTSVERLRRAVDGIEG